MELSVTITGSGDLRRLLAPDLTRTSSLGEFRVSADSPPTLAPEQATIRHTLRALHRAVAEITCGAHQRVRRRQRTLCRAGQRTDSDHGASHARGHPARHGGGRPRTARRAARWRAAAKALRTTTPAPCCWSTSASIRAPGWLRPAGCWRCSPPRCCWRGCTSLARCAASGSVRGDPEPRWRICAAPWPRPEVMPRHPSCSPPCAPTSRTGCEPDRCSTALPTSRARCGERGVGEPALEELRLLFAALEAARYGGADTEGGNLSERLLAWAAQMERNPRR